ncbi:hypothetical protein EUTSA_v10002581mg [Eutrema salsugineum]|uniref:F-box domain-containing protein n=1 Tax=Eutrema salsugineum TaxID=72664 RepID=V4L084_EUTSA|nr:F-box/kelch-repeat protein At4g23580 [Eutrema salsugineum]XP_024009555.1 F-box/kelch-repeat protein At4g23580 [Eutrema salsugineum]ESQ36999.1 hypothetical protein EUTSA_v10002581mg [Eutrema salsugineum]
MNGEEPPLERRLTTVLMLPDDLVLNCLARVSRLYYPTLSMVCKRFRSLLGSMELYQTRTLLGRTESCLYVCLSLSTDSNPLRWFTLCQRPHSSTKSLVPISPPNNLCASLADVAVVGPNIYAIGGLINRKDNNANASSSVMVMDCRSHKWREAPSMGVARVFQSTCVLDENIYVIGGCENLNSTNWMEVFDTNSQTWKFLQIHSEEICVGSEYKSVSYEGTVYVRSEGKDATYKLNKGRWRAADLAMNNGWGRSSSHCVIENVFYRYNGMTVDWYDSKDRLWRTLKGLEILPRLSRCGHVKLTDYGGKMAILWEEFGFVNNHKERIIWCAEIAIEKRQNKEIWAMLEWFDAVSTNNEPYSLAHALVTTI